MMNIKKIQELETPSNIQQMWAPKDFGLSLISKLRGPEPVAREAFYEAISEVRKLGYFKVN